jgi:hypothetical protein
MLVPPDLVSRLASLRSDELAEVASRWAATEGFLPKYGGGSPEAVGEVLRGLADLCRQATAEGKRLLMWVCL